MFISIFVFTLFAICISTSVTVWLSIIVTVYLVVLNCVSMLMLILVLERDLWLHEYCYEIFVSVAII